MGAPLATLYRSEYIIQHFNRNARSRVSQQEFYILSAVDIHPIPACDRQYPAT